MAKTVGLDRPQSQTYCPQLAWSGDAVEYSRPNPLPDFPTSSSQVLEMQQYCLEKKKEMDSKGKGLPGLNQY